MARSAHILPHNVALIWQWQRGLCYLCGHRMLPRLTPSPQPQAKPNTLHPRAASFDHVIPFADGGRRRQNFALACHSCNRAWGCEPPTACEIAFAQWLWQDCFPYGLLKESCAFTARLDRARRRSRDGYRHQRLMRLW